MVKKTRRCRRRTRRYRPSFCGGGKRIYVDVRQITITEPVRTSIESLTPIQSEAAALLASLKRSPGHQGFSLPRLESFRNKNIKSILEEHPIELDTIRNKDAIPFGVQIDGVKKPIYTIRNGRHRFTKAIAEGLTVIPAIILS